MRTTLALRRCSALLFAGVLAFFWIVIAVPGSASAAVSTDPVCQNNGWYPGGQTCIQLVGTGLGNYQVKATGTVNSGLDSAWLTFATPNGVPDPSTPKKVAAKGTITYASGTAAGAGKWCATLKYRAPFIGTEITATNSPSPCVTVPNLPALPGSAKQVCVAPSNFPQFQTCIDVVNGAVVAKGFATVNSPKAYLTLTPPSGSVITGPTVATTAGQTLTFAGPAPATAGTWCANYYNIFPAVPNFAINVTGSTPPCLTV